MAEKPFKTREELKARIKLSGNWNAICVILAFLFMITAVIGDALNETLGLGTITWFLLSFFFIGIGMMLAIHLAVYRHLYGIESEK